MKQLLWILAAAFAAKLIIFVVLRKLYRDWTGNRIVKSWFLLVPVLMSVLSGCATQSTLCQDMTPWECEELGKVWARIHKTKLLPPMRGIFNPPIERRVDL